MSRTWVGNVFVCGVTLALVACGRSPTAPEAPGVSLIMAQGDTRTMPGTDLRVTLLGVATAASIDCMANAPCNLTPAALLEVKVPSAAAEFLSVRLPNPGGGDRASYGGYDVRFLSLQPASGPATPFTAEIAASRQ